MLLPEFLLEELRLARARRSWPAASVHSTRVHRSVVLQAGVKVAERVAINAGVTIGRMSYVNRGTLVASGSIGCYTSIGYDCVIGPETHPVHLMSTSPRLYLPPGNEDGTDASGADISAPPNIGSDVWVGARAVVFQGTTIGHGAVIGAGATVTKDVPPYAIVTGTPARLQRYRFSPDQIEDLLKVSWWNWTDDEIRSRAYLFRSPNWHRLLHDESLL